jgi:RND superfamily putative drug exporter
MADLLPAIGASRSPPGIRSTAGVVTSAAIIKQTGVGLGVAILLDATIVRGILLPSVLSLLGERTWYVPRWLSFLNRLGPTTATPAPTGPSPTPTGPPGR